MKRYLLALLALVGPLVPAVAGPGSTLALKSYVAVVRISSVPASPARVFALQNTSTDQDVLVNRVEVANSSTMTVTGGLMQFWVYGSTAMAHSALTTVQTYGYSGALVTAPTAVSASTAPINVQFDGDSGILTAAQQNGLSGTALPLIRPLIVNDNLAATGQTSDSWSTENPDFGSPIILPKNSQRGLVIEKRQFGASDFSAGAVTIRVHYTLR